MRLDGLWTEKMRPVSSSLSTSANCPACALQRCSALSSRFLLFVAFLIVNLDQLQVCAQRAGFVSVDCGGNADFTSPEGILWKMDDLNFIDHTPGLAASVGGNSSLVLPRELQTLRYFPASASPRKSCYRVGLESENDLQLIRVGFLYGNYDQLDHPPSFFISLDNDYWAFVQLKSGLEPVYFEALTVIPQASLSVCLMRVNGSGAPLINSIEVRMLQSDTYRAYAKDGVRYAENAPIVDRYYLSVARVNFGGPTVRFPLDEEDRIWKDYRTVYPEMSSLAVLNASQSIRLISNTADEPPEAVLETAVMGDHFSFSVDGVQQLLAGSDVYDDASTVELYPAFFFTEIGDLPEGVTRTFNLTCSNVFPRLWANVSGLPAYTAEEYYPGATIYANVSLGENNCTCQTDRIGVSAILNAMDFYTVQYKTQASTSELDVQALDEVRTTYNLAHLWFGDPCLPVPWDAVGCNPGTDKFLRVTSLNLAGMNLSGPIAASIASLTSLTSLNLSNNRINGNFPAWLGSQLPNLQSLDVSNNRIGGNYPDSLAKALGKNFRFSGNDGLCSASGKGCNDHAVDKRKIIIGSVVGGALILAMILTPILYCTFLTHSSKNGLFDKRYRQLQARLKNTGARARPFSYFQIRKITNGLKTKIGEGGFGPVYYGKLKDGQEVALKVLSGKSRQGKQEFYNEIELLSIVHHKHLVSLQGYCQSWNQQVLIYEYMSGGDVGKRLHGKTAASNPLTWAERTSILLEVAEGLLYLHDGCKPAIIHRDVKSNNILLTDRTTAKVADFGLSKLLTVDEDDATHVTTAVKGTTGYLDPEYYITNKLTEKSDVYSYGVLVMETITGRAIVDYSVPSEHMFIVDWVRQAWKAQELDQLPDKNLAGCYDKETFAGLVNLSLWCVERTSVQRPPMTEILKELRRMSLSALSGTPTSPSVHQLIFEPETIDDLGGPSTESLQSTTSSSATKRSSGNMSSDSTS